MDERKIDSVIYPKIYKIRQRFNATRIENIEKEVIEQLELIKIKSKITPGMKIAVTAGSRGISNISLIVKTVCDALKSYGSAPFIVPAMGSHGGATAEGQIYVLKKLGITEETMGVPIVSCMDVVEIGRTSQGAPVYMDKNAFNSDGIVLVNRIKPHTDFNAETESGLIKMISVGLGKAVGCSTMHTYGLGKTIPEAARVAMKKAPILCGVGILENSKDETYKIKAFLPEDIEEQEKLLFEESKQIVPRIPANFLDVLIVNEIGKMFSGTGMDTKVIGRMRIFGEEEPKTPSINKIVVLDIAESSYGNALGIGLADITTKKLVDKIDYDATYANTIPTTFLERAKVPVTMKSDRESIDLALTTIGNVRPEKARLAVIKNTLHLEELYVSEELLNYIDKSKIEILGESREFEFDESGNLILNWR